MQSTAREGTQLNDTVMLDIGDQIATLTFNRPNVIAHAKTKTLLNESLDRSLEQQLEAEVQSFAQCAHTADLKEGVTAFVQKRRAQFNGK